MLAESEPQVVEKAVVSKPLFSCVVRFELIGELKFVGDGPKTDPAFMIGDGLMGALAKGDEPKREAPVVCPEGKEYLK